MSLKSKFEPNSVRYPLGAVPPVGIFSSFAANKPPMSAPVCPPDMILFIMFQTLL
ncbi:MAG: hypothetical protein BWX59_02496 [Bacteroidetes bacterium ADurb.Bin028]|nr:MAG: hypothetical protein BWX59_02496 [Bacteroidetes bacterium ADurb.Bin028]